MGVFSKDNKPPETGKPDQSARPAATFDPQPTVKGDMKKQSQADGPACVSAIAEGTVIVGEVLSDSAITVYGTIKGKLNVKSDLRVAESGLVEAEVEAENVSVSGRIKGRTQARNLFELRTTGTIEGEIVANKVKIDEGGRMIGKIDMHHGSPQATSETAEDVIKKKKELLRGSSESTPSTPAPKK